MRSPPPRRPPVHLVNPMWDANGGADLRTLETYRLLQECADVRLWSEYDPAPALDALAPIHRIVWSRLRWPIGGTLVFVGVYFRIGHWVHFARPRRVVVLYNTDQPDRLAKNLRRLAWTGCAPEVIYTSAALRCRHGGSGRVLESPVDVLRFLPLRVRSPRPFTVGRLSRDIPSKHGDDDPALWRALARRGIRVRIMGGSCLARELGGEPGVELLPSGTEPAARFLQSLDAFVYRTADHWFEAYGRVVVEAMATALPVVAARRGGYVDLVRHGHDGYLFDTTAQAIDAVLTLQARPALAAAMGESARASVAAFNRFHLADKTRTMLAGESPWNASTASHMRHSRSRGARPTSVDVAA